MNIAHQSKKVEKPYCTNSIPFASELDLFCLLALARIAIAPAHTLCVSGEYWVKVNNVKERDCLPLKNGKAMLYLKMLL